MSDDIWVVRAGKGGVFAEGFIEGNFVSIGFPDAGVVSASVDKDVVKAAMQKQNPKCKFGMAVSQIKRFYDEIKVGDSVLTYDPAQRLYFIGTVRLLNLSSFGESPADIDLATFSLTRASSVSVRARSRTGSPNTATCSCPFATSELKR